MNENPSDTIREQVRESYARVAKGNSPGCGAGSSASASSTASCCGPAASLEEQTRRLGYGEEEIGSAPEGANLGLGCGNPAAIAALKAGETVLDLGSGGGFDCFLAARQVGGEGRVIGVDMTPEMIAKARGNASKGGFENVSFRLGEIERLPVPDASVDAILSNCVINLSPDKPAVYREAFRALKPGGRLAISDVVVSAPLPEELRKDAALLAGCVSGAATVDEIEEILAEAGFQDISIAPKDESRAFIREWAPGHALEQYIQSATIEAKKP